MDEVDPELAASMEEECGNPCSPNAPCDECFGYWYRMRHEGLWIDGKGWTAKAFKSW